MKRYKHLQIIIIAILLCGAISSALNQQSKSKAAAGVFTDATVNAQLKAFFPNAVRFKQSTDVLPHIRIYKSSNASSKNLIGIAFETKNSAPDVRGYAGPINMLVGVDLNGTIKGVAALAHQETPTYAHNLDSFLKQFSDKSLNSSLKIGENIDAMTRATVTSAAVVDTLAHSAGVISKTIIEIEEKKIRQTEFDWSQLLMPVILFLLAIKSIHAKTPILRRVTQGCSLFYFGFVMTSMFSVIQIGNTMLLKFPSFSSAPLWYALTALILVSSILYGNIYCGHICPFAGLQGFLYLIFQGLRNRKVRASTPLAFKTRNIKYAILVLSLILIILYQTTDVVIFEPFILLFTFNASKLGWTLVALILILAVFDYRFWCKYLCPAGAFTALLARFSRRQIQPQVEVCGATCHRCVNVCPTEAIRADEKTKIMIDFSECILCGNCLRKCVKGTITYK